MNGKPIDWAVVVAIALVVLASLGIFKIPMSVDDVLLTAGGTLILVAFCVGFSTKTNPRTWNWILLVFNPLLVIGTKLVINARGHG